MHRVLIFVSLSLVIESAAAQAPTAIQTEQAGTSAMDCGPLPSDYKQKLEARLPKLLNRPNNFEIESFGTPRRESLTPKSRPQAVDAYLVDMEIKEKTGRARLRLTHYFCEGEFHIWKAKDMNKP